MHPAANPYTHHYFSADREETQEHNLCVHSRIIRKTFDWCSFPIWENQHIKSAPAIGQKEGMSIKSPSASYDHIARYNRINSQ